MGHHKRLHTADGPALSCSLGRPASLRDIRRLCCRLALVRHRYIQRSLHSDNAGRRGHRGELLLPLGFGQLVMLIPILLGAAHRSVTAQISLLFKLRYSRTIYILRVTSVRANRSVL